MAETKTKPTMVSVQQFLDAVADPTRRADCDTLVAMMQRVTGEPPVLWGPSIVGFGRYHYVYASGHSGDAPLAAFSPRKAEFSVYLMLDLDAAPELLAKLGRHRHGKSCLYIRRLSDIDLPTLEQLVRDSVTAVRAQYPG